MSMSKPLPRRTLIRGAARGLPIAIALPALEAMMGPGRARAQGTVKRFGVFYWGGGTVSGNQFFPGQTGPDFSFSEQTSPLANLKRHVTFVSGATLKHTAKPHNSHRALSVANSWIKRADGYGDPREPSVDQLAAAAWAGKTRLPSLEIGINTKGPYQQSWRKGGGTMGVSTNPQAIFNKLFGAGALPPTAPMAPAAGTATPAPPTAPAKSTTLSQQSVLDAVKLNADRLKARLGATDRARLEAHLDGIRELERRIRPLALPGAPAQPANPNPPTGAGAPAAPVAPPARPGAACMKPATIGGGAGIAGLGRAMADLLAMGLACDLVRAFSFQFSGAQEGTVWSQFGAVEEYHATTHSGLYGKVGPQVVRLAMGVLADIGAALQRLPEGNGSVLDNTLIYATSEFSNSHGSGNHPILLLGRAGGALDGGTNISASGRGVADVMLGCLRASGVPIESLGDPDKATSSVAPGIFRGI
jgi:hypothetical protein